MAVAKFADVRWLWQLNARIKNRLPQPTPFGWLNDQTASAGFWPLPIALPDRVLDVMPLNCRRSVTYRHPARPLDALGPGTGRASVPYRQVVTALRPVDPYWGIIRRVRERTETPLSWWPGGLDDDLSEIVSQGITSEDPDIRGVD